MRHNTLMATLLASASLLPSMQAHAQGVTAVSPPDGYSFDEFFLRDVSADGRTFAGAGFTQGQPRTFFIFDVDGNVEDFQSTCLTCTFAFLTEMSSDGSAALIMGFTENPPFAPINSMEFWSDSTGLVSLDVPAGYVSLNGSELSADGSVVLLQASDHNSTGGGTLRDSFLWVPGQTNYQILTGVAGSDYQHIDGHHLSADGTSLIGQARRHPDSNTWTDQTATADSLGYYWNASTGGHYLEPTTGGLQGGMS